MEKEKKEGQILDRYRSFVGSLHHGKITGGVSPIMVQMSGTDYFIIWHNGCPKAEKNEQGIAASIMNVKAIQHRRINSNWHLPLGAIASDKMQERKADGISPVLTVVCKACGYKDAIKPSFTHSFKAREIKQEKII